MEMSRTEVWSAIDAHRLALCDLLDDLRDDEWVRPSLCDGWTVRDVAAHLTLAQARLPTVLGDLIRAGGRMKHAIHDGAVRRADRPTAQMIAGIRAMVGSQRHIQGVTYRETLIDILVHGQDIALPLGRTLTMTPLPAAVAATRVWQMGYPFRAAKRLAGFTLTATDTDWSAGSGPQVSGPMSAILLVLTGRDVALSRLSGPGADALRHHLTGAPGPDRTHTREHPGRAVMRATVALMLAGVTLAGCGHSANSPNGSKTDEAAAVGAPSPSPVQPSPVQPSPGQSVSLPPGAQPGTDDYDGDGTPDPTCSTQDFGGGLRLRVLCHITAPHEPETGTRLVRNSLYRLPGENIDLTGISGEMIFARDPAGRQVHILIFNSDELFPTGSAQVHDIDTLNATIALINSHFQNVTIQVRGHTDATGTAAANQTLSEERAQTVRTYLLAHGTHATSVTATGFGETRPLVEETNPDGSASLPGRAFNRRVEIVIHGDRTT